MNNNLSRVLCLFLCLNFLTMNVSFAKSQITPDQVITESIIVFNTEMDMGNGHEKALSKMVDILSDHNITTDHLVNYVKSNEELTYSQKVKFQALLDGADDSFDKMDPKSLGIIMGETINMFNPSGLSWSGCASLGVGIVTLVAAITVGIVALTKSIGKEKITERYTKLKNSRTNEYNNRVDWLEEPIESIDNDIDYHHDNIDSKITKISNAHDDLRYWQRRADNDEDPDYAINRMGQILRDIEEYEDSIAYSKNRISYLQHERVKHLSDPNYVITLRNDALINYTSDIAAFNNEMEHKIDLVPKNQALAKKLGIGSALGLAIGGYFLYDGIKKGC